MVWETGKRYLIRYQSDSGEETERIVDLLELREARDGRIFLRAYCHLRGEERTFRADRVSRAERLSGESSAPSTANGIGDTADAAAPGVSRAERKRGQRNATKPLRRFLESLEPLIGIACLAALACMYLYGYGLPGGQDSIARRFPATWSSPVPVPEFKPVLPRVEDTTIGGVTLRTYRRGTMEWYAVPSLSLWTRDKREAVAAIRTPAFVAATGLADPALIERYLRADLDSSGALTLDELEIFQRMTYGEFRYLENSRALRPDKFLEALGGDCEDFALYTAGLLRYWGWDPYLAAFTPPRGGYGHAVCLFYEEGSPYPRHTCFEAKSWVTMDGTPLKPGKYVPIDYDQVGGLTDAVGKGWKLRYIYIPEKAWGLRM